MRLGYETNSLVNHLASRATKGQPVPVVGMGVTILGWTDRNAGTIVKVDHIGGSKVVKYRIEVTEDKATRIDKNGLSEIQEYEYETRHDGYRMVFQFDKRTERWEEVRLNKETGRWIKTRGPGLRIGEREKYYDFTF